MKHYVYDIESYNNFFSVTYIPFDVDQKLVDAYVACDIARIKAIREGRDTTEILKDKDIIKQAMGVRQFVIYDSNNGNNINHLYPIVEWYHEHKTLWGYNSTNYDKPVMTYLLYNAKSYAITGACVDKNNIRLTECVNMYGNRAIEFGAGFEKTQDWLRSYRRNFTDKDLMKILYLDKSFVGLKAVAITLNWYRIQDLPFSPNKVIKDDEVPVLLDYNLNDVLITLMLARSVKSELDLRTELSNEFDIDLTNKSRSSIGKSLFVKYYEMFSGVNRKAWIDKRTYRSNIRLCDIIDNRIKFKTKNFNSLLSSLMNTTINIKDDFNKTILINGKGYVMAKGGLHSIDRAEIFVADNTYRITDIDVNSMYPSGIMRYGICPAHLNKAAFLATIDFLTSERLKAKSLIQVLSRAKTKAEGLKIAINRIYGGFRDDKDPCYDPKCTYQTTINLQLSLMMLIEDMELNGFEVISANTDGLTIRYKRESRDMFISIYKNWEEVSGLTLEETEYERYIRSNVNNYIAIKAGFNDTYTKAVNDGCNSKDEINAIESKYIKRKGSYSFNIDFTKGFRHPIVSKAINNYLIYGTDYREYIKSHCKAGRTNIYDFCVSQKVGKDFKCKAIKVTSDGVIDIPLQKYNRFYVTNSNNLDGVLIVKSKGDKNISILANQSVVIFNDYVKLDDYNINYGFYIHLVEEYLYGNKGKAKNIKPKDEGIVSGSNKLFTNQHFDNNLKLDNDFNIQDTTDEEFEEYVNSLGEDDLLF